MLSNFRKMLLASASLLVTSQASADVWVFGDSLSDTGNFQLISEAARQNFFIPPEYRANRQGYQRISNGKVAVEYVAPLLGQSQLIPSLAGGTNFATFGARLEDPSLSEDCSNAVIADFGCQILAFTSTYQVRTSLAKLLLSP